jgi:uncharacterized protein (TIGR02996 family)
VGDEDAFIRAIQAHQDDASKLVYADWLEEHGQPARAGYLRRLVDQGAGTNVRPSPHLAGEVGLAWTDLVHGRTLLQDAATLLALGRLEGLLWGHAGFNDHASDIGFDFSVTLVRPQGALAELAARHFGDAYTPVSLERLEDWQTTLRAVLGRWLFQSLEHLPEGGARLFFQVDYGRRSLTDRVMQAIVEVVRPRTGWRARVTPRRFYALDWDDLVLEAEDRVLFLHFSQSD